MCVMLEDGRSVEAFAAAGMGTSTDVLVRLVAIEQAASVRCNDGVVGDGCRCERVGKWKAGQRSRCLGGRLLGREGHSFACELTIMT